MCIRDRWQPGTDHAAIATEVKVIDKLKKEGIDKHEIGREEFLKHAWAWKEEYGGKIINQLKKLGASADWERERFTKMCIRDRQKAGDENGASGSCICKA